MLSLIRLRRKGFSRYYMKEKKIKTGLQILAVIIRTVEA